MYSNAHTAEMESNCRRLAAEMQTLMLDGLARCNSLANPKAKQHMFQGVGRRLGAIRLAMVRMFELYPPGQTQPLPRATLEELQIYLQAYVINLYGIFDNWAWAFAYHHDLLAEIGGPMGVSLFKRETRRFLPPVLRDYLSSTTITAWHDDYLKGYRDALAHRIPLYMPPAMWTKADEEEYKRLEQEKAQCIHNSEWERLDEVWAQQDVIGKACPTVMHEFSDDPKARPVYLHPQLICDTGAVVEFGKLFLTNWHERSTPPASDTTNAAELSGLLQRAKRVASRYRELTGRPLGIAGEIAEAEAVRLLGVELAPVRTAGYDVMRTTREGGLVRLQVKGRVLSAGKPKGRLGRIDVKHPDWDGVLLVLMDLNFNTLEIFEAPRERIVEELTREGSKARNERGSLSIAAFCSPTVSRKVWAPTASA